MCKLKAKRTHFAKARTILDAICRWRCAGNTGVGYRGDQGLSEAFPRDLEEWNDKGVPTDNRIVDSIELHPSPKKDPEKQKEPVAHEIIMNFKAMPTQFAIDLRGEL